MLQCCELTEKNNLFLSYFAVGKTFRAFLFDALKVGVTYQSLNLCYIYLLINFKDDKVVGYELEYGSEL